jgi:hypothetical protein
VDNPEVLSAHFYVVLLFWLSCTLSLLQHLIRYCLSRPFWGRRMSSVWLHGYYGKMVVASKATCWMMMVMPPWVAISLMTIHKLPAQTLA